MSRTAPQLPERGDARPIVRTAGSGNRAIWFAGVGLLCGGILLFSALNGRRERVMAATAAPAASTADMIVAPPPLTIPPDRVIASENDYEGAEAPSSSAAFGSVGRQPPAVLTRVIERVVPAPSTFDPESLPQPTVESMPVKGLTPASSSFGGQEERDERVMARRLLNPSFTVPQGTIVAAVLETALDSTRAGGVRAIVSRDVRSFDGSRVLIPRGSRLYGEYTSDVSAGQKRALVRWRRLTRPDAVIMDLDSPAADPLGRAGIKGKVDSHFFARFGGAILQSVLDIGVGVATRSVAGDSVIVALPGGTQQIVQQGQSQVQPTLTVKQGTSVSVFVARDLDFSTVDG